MIRKQLLLTGLFALCSASVWAADVSIGVTDTTIEFKDNTNYLITGKTGGETLVLESTNTGNKNLPETTTFTMIDGTSATISMLSSINFNGFTVAGDGILTLTNKEGNTAKSTVAISGVVVDSATFNVNLGSNILFQNGDALLPLSFQVKNNGTLNWNTSVFPSGNYTTKYFTFDVENGSSFVVDLSKTDVTTAADTENYFIKVANSTIAGKMVLNSSVANFYADFYEATVISNQSASDVSKIARFRLRKGASLTISSSQEKSIELTNQGIIMNEDTTLTLNSKNAMYYLSGTTKKTNMDLIFTGASSVVLGASNDLGKFELRKNAVSLDLGTNNNMLTLDKVTIETGGLLTISNFKDGAIQIDTLASDFFTGEQGKVGDDVIFQVLKSNYITTSDNQSLVYFVDNTGNFKDYFGQVWTLTGANALIAAVPEPAEWATIFGAIALGFVAYRRRK